MLIKEADTWFQLFLWLWHFSIKFKQLRGFPGVSAGKNLPAKQELLFSCQVMPNSLWHNELQHARLPCLHYLPEFAQTHVPWVSDTIQPSHLLLPSSPLALNLSQEGMATYTSILICRTEPGGHQSIEWQESDMTEVTEHACIKD